MGKLLGQHETNRKEYCNAIITHSGKQLEEPHMKGDGLNKKELENNTAKNPIEKPAQEHE